MIKCKTVCPLGKFNGCCVECKEFRSCEDACVHSPDQCGTSIIEEISEETGVELFKQNKNLILTQISAVINTKKALEEQEKQLKEQLKQAMEFYNIKKFESDLLNITYVAETTSTSIDSTKLKKKYPDIAEECSRESKRSAYVKVAVK